MMSLITDILLGTISLFLILFGSIVGVVSVLVVYIPRIDFPGGAISSLVKFIPGVKARQVFDLYLLGRHPDYNFCRRVLIGLLGAILSFAITLSPLVLYYDVRLYLFFLGLDLFLGALGLTYYFIFACYSRNG